MEVVRAWESSSRTGCDGEKTLHGSRQQSTSRRSFPTAASPSRPGSRTQPICIRSRGDSIRPFPSSGAHFICGHYDRIFFSARGRGSGCTRGDQMRHSRLATRCGRSNKARVGWNRCSRKGERTITRGGFIDDACAPCAKRYSCRIARCILVGLYCIVYTMMDARKQESKEDDGGI